jgi:tRNA-dihydrouridine synthase B
MALLKKIGIGNLITENNVFLAPLAGVGDSAYRIVGRRFGAGLTCSEMVSSCGIVRGNRKTFSLLKIGRAERPAGIQLLGSDPGTMAEAAQICSSYPADYIDINAGCSVKKVIKTGAGAMLLDEPDRLHRIVSGCVGATELPVTVKMRLGLSERRITVVENVHAVREAGAALVTLHPRTAADRYSGRARWEYIRIAKEHAGIPVCGNGDIVTEADAVRMMEETGCDAVMIGRAAIGNPWILTRIVAAFASYPKPPVSDDPGNEQRINQALEHLALIVRMKGEIRGVHEAKKHIHRYLKGIPHAAHVRAGIFTVEDSGEASRLLRSLL